MKTIIGDNMVKDMKMLTKKNLVEKLEEMIPDVQELIMDLYDSELVAIVTDPDSRANPLFYRDDFLDEVENFNYVEEHRNGVVLNVPSMDNFPFRNRLIVIRHILEGVMGTYIEVDGQQYETLFNKRPINEEPFDKYVPKKEMIYLIRRSPKIIQLWRERLPNDEMVVYPFSNFPPIRFFEIVEEFVDNNLDEWIDEAIEDSQKEFAKEYGK